MALGLFLRRPARRRQRRVVACLADLRLLGVEQGVLVVLFDDSGALGPGVRPVEQGDPLAGDVAVGLYEGGQDVGEHLALRCLRHGPGHAEHAVVPVVVPGLLGRHGSGLVPGQPGAAGAARLLHQGRHGGVVGDTYRLGEFGRGHRHGGAGTGHRQPGGQAGQPGADVDCHVVDAAARCALAGGAGVRQRDPRGDLRRTGRILRQHLLQHRPGQVRGSVDRLAATSCCSRTPESGAVSTVDARGDETRLSAQAGQPLAPVGHPDVDLLLVDEGGSVRVAADDDDVVAGRRNREHGERASVAVLCLGQGRTRLPGPAACRCRSRSGPVDPTGMMAAG